MILPMRDAQTPVAGAARGEMPEARTDAAKPRSGHQPSARFKRTSAAPMIARP